MLGVKAIELIGDVDAEHRLRAQVPEDLPAGPVRLLVLLPEPDQADEIWMRAVASEWSEDLSDPRQDLYTLDDGQPPDGAR
jgi:hypothetical protein